ncbi:MAG: amino acid ABC transporter permease [Candidatus Thermoplasmatota archaeon]
MDVLLDSAPQLLDGLKNTLGLTFFGVLLGTVCGLLLAFGRCFGPQPVAFSIYLYEKLFRGIPLLVILILIYFGLAQIGFDLNAFTAAVLGLGLRSAAYQAQIFRGAIQSIPEGQLSASYSLGMTKIQTIRYILLPQVLRLSIPGWSNEFTILLKDTSIAISIGVVELMRQGRYIYVREPDLALAVFLLIAALYLILVLIINKSLSLLEKKYRMSGYDVECCR